MGKQWKQWQNLFPLAPKWADGDCSHEIKRCLLLGRKVMTNLDSILKSRDITLRTKVLIAKAVLFPVVMYRYESWTTEKVECQRTDAFAVWCCRRLLRVTWTARRSNQSILKEINPEYPFEGLVLKLLLSHFSRVWPCATPIHISPWGSPVPGILQTRVLEWVAISFSNAWKWKVKVKSFSHVQLFVTPWTAAHQAPLSMGFSRQKYWSGVPSPSPGAEARAPIFCLPTAKNQLIGKDPDAGKDWRLKEMRATEDEIVK